MSEDGEEFEDIEDTVRLRKTVDIEKNCLTCEYSCDRGYRTGDKYCDHLELIIYSDSDNNRILEHQCTLDGLDLTKQKKSELWVCDEHMAIKRCGNCVCFQSKTQVCSLTNTKKDEEKSICERFNRDQ